MFRGDGSGLFNIPRTALTEDAFRIASGSVTASVSPVYGFRVESANSGSEFTGSVIVSGSVSASLFEGSGAGLTDIPLSALAELVEQAFQIATGSVTASVDAQRGFRVESLASGSQFTGRVNISGSLIVGQEK